PAVPSPTLALAVWCPLSPTGAQTTQLLVEPPWRPAVLWDRVTLTCQGSGTAGDTTWYKDGQHWWQEGHDRFSVTESGTYTCDRPGTGRSPLVTVSDDDLVLQVPAQPLLEGDTVTLRCRGWFNNTVTEVRFYQDEKDLRGPVNVTELSLSPLQLNHSGSYSCKGLVRSFMSQSAAVTVTVHVAAGVGGALLFLLLLVGVIVAWHQGHRLFLLVLEIILCLCHVTAASYWPARKAKLEQQRRRERLEQGAHGNSTWTFRKDEVKALWGAQLGTCITHSRELESSGTFWKPLVVHITPSHKHPMGLRWTLGVPQI
ncbi:low affinity immunoglobulin gamma Fc region receptor III-B-like, partial [Ammospiza maritima maritima]